MYLCPKEAVVKESSIAPDKGNKMIGSKDVTAIGITSVIHQIETHAVDAKTALAWGFNPSGWKKNRIRTKDNGPKKRPMFLVLSIN